MSSKITQFALFTSLLKIVYLKDCTEPDKSIIPLPYGILADYKSYFNVGESRQPPDFCDFVVFDGFCW